MLMKAGKHIDFIMPRVCASVCVYVYKGCDKVD